jgi:hypothetical protein
MNKILKFWLRFFFVRLHLDGGDPNAGGGGSGSLLNGGTGGGGGVDWRADLPEDIRADPSLATFKAKDHKEALGVIAKSYIHAQKLVGVDKIAKPNDKWTPEQWKAFNKEMGVPETHDKYSVPKFEFAEGLTLDEKKLDGYKKIFHEAGVTPKQAEKIMVAYFADVNGDFTGRAESQKAAMLSATNELKQEFGDKYDAKLDIARSVLKKYGSDTLLQKLESSGLANDPEVVRMFAKLGEGMMEDRAGGSGDGLILQEATQANQEINRLKSDADFQTALNTRGHAGHKAAVEKWLDLHKAAASRKE